VVLCVLNRKKNATNYHDEINSDLFYDWFRGVLPRLENNCIIVMDDVPYHSLKKDPIPTLDWRKENIIKWLVSKNCVVDQSMIKYQLMEMVNQMKPLYDKNVIDEEALKTNKVVLRLPPLHDELNPVELALLTVKNHVKTHNNTWKLSDVGTEVNRRRDPAPYSRHVVQFRQLLNRGGK